MNAKYLNPTVCLIKYVAAIIAFDGLLRPSKMLVRNKRTRVKIKTVLEMAWHGEQNGSM